LTQGTSVSQPWVAVLMGSQTDWETMLPAREIFDELKIPSEVRIISAHRTPDALFEYVETAESRGIQIIVAGAGGAAHLPGMIAAKTLLPVIGVPVNSTPLGGLDALLAIVQMPKGTPVATMAIGKAGAANAAFLPRRFSRAPGRICWSGFALGRRPGAPRRSRRAHPNTYLAQELATRLLRGLRLNTAVTEGPRARP